jgi:hypothetical protein
MLGIAQPWKDRRKPKAIVHTLIGLMVVTTSKHTNGSGGDNPQGRDAILNRRWRKASVRM